ncbi:MAG: DNA-binding response regulator [Candidatus Pseudobacter hemicellulosilyticus]|uniref:DNA-binding response regulator n=1 Tax=Candidatus Pseudobacter hemicellulosilyticus TaxID=3121375 RepID=A0AAJ6BI00_9BACT|nr:MAG: DNA-binding response regulator [Pseudobacter sp.]
MIRVLIVEDEIIIARFIEQQLQASFRCSTRIAVSAAEVAMAMPEMLPQLVLCDINLEEKRTGIELVAELQQSYVFEVIYITSYQSRSIIEQASATRPANYIIKPVDEAQLFAGVKLVMDRMASQPVVQQRQELLEKLTPVERRILRLISQRKTTREIAGLLHFSHYTIKNHRHRICRKLELKDENYALLRWVLEQGEKLAEE